MRIKRVELVIIALTLAFACFLGGYFTGRRSAVNIITVASPHTGSQAAGPGSASSPGNETAVPGNASADEAETVERTGDSSSGNHAESDGDEQTHDIIGLPRGGDGRININTATRGELMDLSGIGEVIAGRVIDYRNQHGRFESIEDIMKVSGIGERRFEAIKDQITVG